MRADSPWTLPVGWLLLSGSLALSVIALPPLTSSLKDNLARTQSGGVDDRLMNVQPKSHSSLLEQSGGFWGQHGWYLAGRESGILRIKLPGAERGIVKLRLWLFSPGQLSVSVKEDSGQQVISEQKLDGRLLQIPVHGPSQLVIESSSDVSQEQLVLDRYAAAWFPPDDELPSLWPLSGMLLLALGGWATIAISRRLDSLAWISMIVLAAIMTAALVGFVLRWNLFDFARGLPADPDAASYLTYAKNFTWLSTDHGFYSGNFNEREPLHVAALNAWLRFWGQNAPAVRLYTVSLSAILIVAIGIFIWKLSDRALFGIAASWIVAVSPAWIDESVRGLRLETMSLLLLGALSTWIWANRWIGSLLLGMLTGFMALLQSTAMSVVLPLIWLGWLINRYRAARSQPRLSPAQWSWFHLIAATVVAIALYMPHLYGLYVVHGDPSWPSYGYARWNANIEFPQRLGTSGFPSREEFEKNTYAGPRISYAEYLFGLHTIPQLIYGQLRGWIESIVYMSVSPTPRLKSLIFLQQASGFSAVLRHVTTPTVIIFALLLFLTAIGWIDLWRQDAYWWVPFLSLWGIWYAAFLYGVRVIEPFRHTGHVYSLLLFCFLWGALQTVQWLQRMWVFRLSQSVKSLHI